MATAATTVVMPSVIGDGAGGGAAAHVVAPSLAAGVEASKRAPRAPRAERSVMTAEEAAQNKILRLMVKILRHGATINEKGKPVQLPRMIDIDGAMWIRFTLFLELMRLNIKDFTMTPEEFARLVELESNHRLAIKGVVKRSEEFVTTGEVFVRANQGHSGTFLAKLLEVMAAEISAAETADAETSATETAAAGTGAKESIFKVVETPYSELHHGTTAKNWPLIAESKALKMISRMIHLSPPLDETASAAASSDTRHGHRENSEIVIVVDMAAAMAAGIVFYEADTKNKMVLTFDDIPLTFFKKVVNRRTGEVLYSA